MSQHNYLLSGIVTVFKGRLEPLARKNSAAASSLMPPLDHKTPNGRSWPATDPEELYPNVGNPIGSRRSRRKYGFRIASVRFGYFGVRREGPLSFFVGVGLGSGPVPDRLRKRTPAALLPLA
jgi:hypothetical protein